MNIKCGVAAAALLLAPAFVGTAHATTYNTGETVVGGIDQNYAVLGYIPGNSNNSNDTLINASPAPGYTSAPGSAYVYSNGAYPSGLTFISSAANGGAGLDTTVYTVQFDLGFSQHHQRHLGSRQWRRSIRQRYLYWRRPRNIFQWTFEQLHRGDRFFVRRHCRYQYVDVLHHGRWRSQRLRIRRYERVGGA